MMTPVARKPRDYGQSFVDIRRAKVVECGRESGRAAGPGVMVDIDLLNNQYTGLVMRWRLRATYQLSVR